MQRIRIGISWSGKMRLPRTDYREGVGRLLERICRNLPKHGLELGKQLLDRIQIWAVCRKVNEIAPRDLIACSTPSTPA